MQALKPNCLSHHRFPAYYVCCDDRVSNSLSFITMKHSLLQYFSLALRCLYAPPFVPGKGGSSMKGIVGCQIASASGRWISRIWSDCRRHAFSNGSYHFNAILFQNHDGFGSVGFNPSDQNLSTR
jgi:hypothetical protein